MPTGWKSGQDVKKPVPVWFWDWLTTVRDQLAEDKRRNVTFAEAFEHVKAEYETRQELPS